MQISNKKLLILLTAVLCLAGQLPLYAEKQYIFPDEIINRSVNEQPDYNLSEQDKNNDYSVQQQYWRYPQYVSDFEKQNLPQKKPLNFNNNTLRYPQETYKTPVRNSFNQAARTSKLLYPSDLLSEKKSYKKDRTIKNRDNRYSSNYPASLAKDRQSSHNQPDRRYYNKYTAMQNNKTPVVRYKYIPVPVYSIPGMMPDMVNMPYMLSGNETYRSDNNRLNNSRLPTNRSNAMLYSRHASPEAYGAFPSDLEHYNNNAKYPGDILNFDYLFPQLGSINPDF